MNSIHTLHGTFGSPRSLSNPNGALFNAAGGGGRARTQSTVVPSTHVTVTTQRPTAAVTAVSPRYTQPSTSYGTEGSSRELKAEQQRPRASNSFGNHTVTVTSSAPVVVKQRAPQRTSIGTPKPFIRPILSATDGISKSSSHRTNSFTRPDYTASVGNAKTTRAPTKPPTCWPFRDPQECQPFKIKSALHWDGPNTVALPEQPLVISVVTFPQVSEDTKISSVVTRPPSSNSLSSITSTSSASSFYSTCSHEDSTERRAEAERERQLHWRYLACMLLNRTYSRTTSRTRSRREFDAISDAARGKIDRVRGAPLCGVDKLPNDEAIEKDDFSIVIRGRTKAIGRKSKSYVKSGLSNVVVYTVDA